MFVKHCCGECVALSSSWHKFLILVLYFCFLLGFHWNIPAVRWAERLLFETYRDLCGKLVSSDVSRSAFTTLKRSISNKNGKEIMKYIKIHDEIQFSVLYVA